MIYVFIALFLVMQSLEVLGTANVGTVLFSRADLDNDTWNTDDVALLRARLYFQHLLPPIITPQSPNYVERLLKYFKDGYLTISRQSGDIKIDKILTLAFTDVIGGYMKMFALPIAKYAYYGGSLPKRDTLKLFLFYEDLKNYLEKNGSGWAAPDYGRLDAVTINVALQKLPLVRSMAEQDPCINLSYFEKTSQGLSVPTPKIDWATRTMFLPIANQSLVDLHSTNMTDALLKYYNSASNCLLLARPNKLENFNQRFQLWLQEDVMPHLNDDRLYAPLQGVLSLINNTYDAETYQYLMKNYASSDLGSSYCKHSKKLKIIIAIVLFEIICCVPTVIYVMFRKRKNKSGGSSSHVNMVFETRTDRSYSDYALRLSKSSPLKRHGGLKWRQKSLAMMEAGEANTSRSLHSMGTDMNSCLLPEGCEDMATMVDEFLDQRKQNSCKVVQTVARVASSANAMAGLPANIEASDDTGKTVTLSSTSGPSKTTTVKILRHTKKTARPICASSTTVIKPSESPARHPASKYAKIEAKKELKKEYKKERNLTNPTTADYLKSQLYKEAVTSHQTSKALIPVKHSVTKKADDERKVKEKSKTFKIHAEEESIMIQGGNNPYVEICIDRPQLELYTVGVSRNEETNLKKLGSPATPRASRIPKRAPGFPQLRAIRYKPASGSTPRERKSMIPVFNRALDDSFLKTSSNSRVDKLNDTL